MKFLSKYEKLLGHPLVLLLIGTILSSIIIPAAAYQFSYVNNNKKLRVALSQELIDKDVEIKVGLNKLKSCLEIFIDDYCYFYDTLDSRILQDDLREEMNDNYLEFERTAWFWHAKYNLKAHGLGIGKPDSDSLSSYLEKYNLNVSRASKSIDTLWVECLRRDFSCDTARLNPIKSYVKKTIDMLHFERADIIRQMIDFISDIELDRKAII